MASVRPETLTFFDQADSVNQETQKYLTGTGNIL
jgi:hypothetical protein